MQQSIGVIDPLKGEGFLESENLDHLGRFIKDTINIAVVFEWLDREREFFTCGSKRLAREHRPDLVELEYV
jgi:hypothetical protein